MPARDATARQAVARAAIRSMLPEKRESPPGAAPSSAVAPRKSDVVAVTTRSPPSVTPVNPPPDKKSFVTTTVTGRELGTGTGRLASTVRRPTRTAKTVPAALVRCDDDPLGARAQRDELLQPGPRAGRKANAQPMDAAALRPLDEEPLIL
jgi:hypothetical protein